MDTWSDIIGEFSNLKSKSLGNNLGKFFYMTLLKHRDNILNCLNSDVNPYVEFETLHQIQNPKKGKEKYTFKKMVKNKEGVLEEKDCSYKKLVMINQDLKNAFIFILNVFVKECYDCYVKNGKKFEKDVLDQVFNFVQAEREEGHMMAPAIIKSQELFDVDKLIPTVFHDMTSTLTSKVKGHFADDDNNIPDDQISDIVRSFIKFIQVIAVLIMDTLWNNKRSINISVLFGQLRQLSTLLSNYDCDIGQELLDDLNLFVVESRPAKKTNTTKSTKKTSKKKEENEDDSDDSPNVEDAMNDLATGEDDWNEDATDS